MLVRFTGVIVGADMNEDLTKTRLEVLNRLKAQRSKLLQDLAEQPGDAATRARLQDLEDCIAAIDSALKKKKERH